MNDPAAIAVRNALVERDKWRAKAEALELERASFIEHIARLQRELEQGRDRYGRSLAED